MPRLRRSLFAFFLSLALASLASAATPGLPQVFGASVPGARVLPKVDSRMVVRARAVQPDLNAIAVLAARTIGGERPHFLVDLFPGLELEAETLTAERRSSGGTTLIARLTGVEMGTAVLTVEQDVLTATVEYVGASFIVTIQADGTYRVAEIDPRAFPAEGAPLLPPINVPTTPTPPSTSSAPAFDVPTDSGRLIDVLIVWTSAAQAAAGGLAAMQSLTQAAVDNANAAYLNSGIAQRIRRVYLPAAAVSYAETTACGSDVFTCALQAVTNDQIANVFGWRNTYAADLVSLLISDNTFCGIAWLPFSPSNPAGNAAKGFSVVDQGCAVGNKSFAHELGHNMGAHHDPYVLGAGSCGDGKPPGAFCYSRGFSHIAADAAHSWRTVMAYNNECQAHFAGGCVRLLYFSNPNVECSATISGNPNCNAADPIGEASYRNNALTLNKTAKTVASYRDPPAIPVTATYPAYADVAPGSAFYGSIEFMREAQYTGGCAVGMYCPDDPVMRRAMAAFLERVNKAANYSPAAAGTVFADVPASAQFAGYIEAIAADGITSGCTATTFCPDNPVRRDQMAKFILKGKCGSTYVPAARPSAYTDVPTGSPFADYITKLSLLGITSGCGGTNYCPEAYVTRAAMAKFLEKSFPFGYPTEVCTP